jgi:hypothetical protein
MKFEVNFESNSKSAYIYVASLHPQVGTTKMQKLLKSLYDEPTLNFDEVLSFWFCSVLWHQLLTCVMHVD